MSRNNKEVNTGLQGVKIFDAPLLGGSSNEPINPDSILRADAKAANTALNTHKKTVSQTQVELLVTTWLSGKSINTRRAYLRIVEDFFSFIHPGDLKTTSIHHVQGFMNGRSGERRASRALKTAAIKSLFTFAQKTGYLVANLGAFIPGVKTDSKITDRYLSEEEVKRMIDVTETPREEAIIRLLYSGGLRVSELVGLNWEDLQTRAEGEAQLKIRGKGDKVRVVMISPLTLNAVMKLKTTDTPWRAIFASDYGTVTRLTDRTVRDIVFKLAMRAGVKKKVSPHWLRHAHASHALDRGAPIHLVQSTLGHASIATTGRYLHARPSESSGKYLSE